MKLLRKDVLKWIRALKSGQYRKGTGELVSPDGSKFCCLGVWADMHGAVWEEKFGWDDNVCGLTPKPTRQKAVHREQERSEVLKDPRLARGLSMDVQNALAETNDASRGFAKVIAKIEKDVLPLAK